MSISLRLSRAQHDSGQADIDELKALEERKRTLEAQIRNMSAEPEKILREALEQAATLPPPDDLADRRRLRKFEEVVSRRQVRNERRTQGRSLLLLLMLLVATALLTSWVVKLFVG